MAENHFYNQGFIQSLVKLIQTNIGNENFGARELAEAAGMSQRKLSFKLRTIKNTSVSCFIREIRLQKALEMLQNDDVTASEVAYKVGFGSATYFNKCFHEYYGYPPGKIRKKDFDNSEESNLFKKISEYLSGKSILRNVTYSFGGLIVIAGLLLLADYIFVSNSSARDSKIISKNQERSLAVLPFKNLSDNTANQYFIDGLMEEILNDLSRIGDLKVISRTSVEQFRESSMTTSDIAKKLHVDYLVTGSGQKYDNSYQLRVRLIDAKNDKQLWAESYEKEIRETKDIYGIQNQIAQSIAQELKTTITPEEKRLFEKIPTKNLTAYDFFLRGTAELTKYWTDVLDTNNRQALNKARELFKNALTYDSTFASVYARLANVYLSMHGNDSFLSANYLDSMLIFTDHALAYDDHLAEAYGSRANFFYYTGQAGKSVKELEQAIKYDPKSGRAYKTLAYLYTEDKEHADFVKALEYAYRALSLISGTELVSFIHDLGMFYLLSAGFPDIAKDYFQEAFRLDGKIDVYNANLAVLEIASGNKEKALELIRQTYERDTNKVESILWLGYMNYLTSRYEASLYCLRKVEKSLEAATPFNLGPISFNEIAYVYLINGNEKEADMWFDKQMKFSEVSIKFGRKNGITGSDYYELAALYAFQGDRKKAFENLREFAKIHICSLATLTDIKSNPFFNNIRNEPEFQKIVSDLEVKYQKEHERVQKWLEKHPETISLEY